MVKGNPDIPLRDDFLAAALPAVIFEGWSDGLIIATAKVKMMSPDVVKRLFPEGVLSLVVHFFDWISRQTALIVAEENVSALKMKPRMLRLIQARLTLLTPYREAFRQALAFLAMPGRILTAAQVLYRTVNDLWYLAGDKATDFNFYTKRTLLAGVVSSADIFWLADQSPAFADTTAFVERQLDRTLTVGKRIGTLKDKVRSISAIFFRQKTTEKRQNNL